MMMMMMLFSTRSSGGSLPAAVTRLVEKVPGRRGRAATYSTSSSPKKVVGILGGGISGLSAAYYLVQKFGDSVRPIIFEQSGRVGGWVKTVKTGSGSMYEVGPRTLRPAGISGMNTLDLIEELKLHTNVLYVEKSHPTANNRFIYLREKLVKLPSDMKVLFRKQEPFTRPLVWALFRDLVKMRKRADDDTIHSFVTRRFGSEIADYLTDPLIRGICAGDSKKISVKFLMKSMFELEQKYGSVALGYLMSKLSKSKCGLSDEEKTIGFSNIALASLTGNWAVWTLEDGLERLPEAMEQFLVSNNVQIRKNTRVTGVSIENMVDEVEVKFHVGGDERKSDAVVCNHVVSALPTYQLTRILRTSKPSHPELWKVFETIGGSASLQVTGLTYDELDLIKERAFGFLVPSSEKSVSGLLGVVFDSHSFPQGDNTVITVMSRGSGNALQDMDTVKGYVSKTLGISREPIDSHTEFLEYCIPQYTIGHYEKVDVVRRYIKAAKLPLTLAGASFDGVSVNDCILSGRNAAAHLRTLFDQQQEQQDRKQAVDASCSQDSSNVINKASN